MNYSAQLKHHQFTYIRLYYKFMLLANQQQKTN